MQYVQHPCSNVCVCVCVTDPHSLGMSIQAMYVCMCVCVMHVRQMMHFSISALTSLSPLPSPPLLFTILVEPLQRVKPCNDQR